MVTKFTKNVLQTQSDDILLEFAKYVRQKYKDAFNETDEQLKTQESSYLSNKLEEFTIQMGVFEFAHKICDNDDIDHFLNSMRVRVSRSEEKITAFVSSWERQTDLLDFLKTMNDSFLTRMEEKLCITQVGTSRNANILEAIMYLGCTTVFQALTIKVIKSLLTTIGYGHKFHTKTKKEDLIKLILEVGFPNNYGVTPTPQEIGLPSAGGEQPEEQPETSTKRAPKQKTATTEQEIADVDVSMDTSLHNEHVNQLLETSKTSLSDHENLNDKNEAEDNENESDNEIDEEDEEGFEKKQTKSKKRKVVHQKSAKKSVVEEEEDVIMEEKDQNAEKTDDKDPSGASNRITTRSKRKGGPEAGLLPINDNIDKIGRKPVKKRKRSEMEASSSTKSKDEEAKEIENASIAEEKAFENSRKRSRSRRSSLPMIPDSFVEETGKEKEKDEETTTKPPRKRSSKKKKTSFSTKKKKHLSKRAESSKSHETSEEDEIEEIKELENEPEIEIEQPNHKSIPPASFENEIIQENEEIDATEAQINDSVRQFANDDFMDSIIDNNDEKSKKIDKEKEKSHLDAQVSQKRTFLEAEHPNSDMHNLFSLPEDDELPPANAGELVAGSESNAIADSSSSSDTSNLSNDKDFRVSEFFNQNDSRSSNENENSITTSKKTPINQKKPNAVSPSPLLLSNSNEIANISAISDLAPIATPLLLYGDLKEPSKTPSQEEESSSIPLFPEKTTTTTTTQSLQKNESFEDLQKKRLDQSKKNMADFENMFLSERVWKIDKYPEERLKQMEAVEVHMIEPSTRDATTVEKDEGISTRASRSPKIMEESPVKTLVHPHVLNSSQKTTEQAVENASDLNNEELNDSGTSKLRLRKNIPSSSQTTTKSIPKQTEKRSPAPIPANVSSPSTRQKTIPEMLSSRNIPTQEHENESPNPQQQIPNQFWGEIQRILQQLPQQIAQQTATSSSSSSQPIATTSQGSFFYIQTLNVQNHYTLNFYSGNNNNPPENESSNNQKTRQRKR